MTTQSVTSQGKLCSADDAVARIFDGATIAVDGAGGGVNDPDLVLRALEERFLATGQPRDLYVIAPNGLGDGRDGGIQRFAHPGMVRRVVCGHWGWAPGLQKMAVSGDIEAYCLPQGALSHLMRATAAGLPGSLSRVGLGTFVDPRLDGGALNSRTPKELVELVTLGDETCLLYRRQHIDVAIIRGTAADEHGNLTMDSEGLYAETLSMAQAVRNCGGYVIAQARDIVAAGSLDARRVKVPGILIDAVVHNPHQALSCEFQRDPSMTAETRAPAAGLSSMPLNVRKVIARRAALELRAGEVVNLGYGVPDGVAAVLAEEHMTHAVHFTLEQGHVGGVPVLGDSFGLARNQEAMIDAGYQFDFYDGGGLDVAVLSFAEFDAAGNVNVGKFGGRIPGVGGFINIAQGAKRVIFVGTLTAGRAVGYGIGDGKLTLTGDTGRPKVVDRVEQICFSGETARAAGKRVTYVSERAVFELEPHGITLTEVAPGVDLERDVLGRIGFTPLISPSLRTMSTALFRPEPVGLALTLANGGL